MKINTKRKNPPANITHDFPLPLGFYIFKDKLLHKIKWNFLLHFLFVHSAQYFLHVGLSLLSSGKLFFSKYANSLFKQGLYSSTEFLMLGFVFLFSKFCLVHVETHDVCPSSLQGRRGVVPPPWEQRLLLQGDQKTMTAVKAHGKHQHPCLRPA